MNPLCLLTKGRTFKDMAPRPGAYKLLANSAPPKAATGKRAAAAAPQPVPEAAQKSLFDEPKPTVAPTVVEVPKADVLPAVPAISKSPFAPGAEQQKTAAWKRAVSWMQGSVWGQKRRPAHASTVQAELALEKVTVLRNDLNEDDLEVVLVERKVGTGEKPLARLSKMEMTSDAWIKLMAPFRKKSIESASNPQAGAATSPELSART